MNIAHAYYGDKTNGRENTGDVIIRDAVNATLQSIDPNISVTCICESQPVNLSANSYDFLLVGGGQVWGAGLGYTPPIEWATANNIPFGIYAVGGEPHTIKRFSSYLQIMAEQATFITVRDNPTWQAFDEIGIPTILTADCAFSYLDVHNTRYTPDIVLSVPSHQVNIINAVNGLARDNNMQVHNRYFSVLDCNGDIDSLVDSYHQYIEEINHTGLAIVSRYHALIICIMAGVPFLVSSYVDNKFGDLVSFMGLEKYMIPYNSGWDSREVRELLDDIIKNYIYIKQSIVLARPALINLSQHNAEILEDTLLSL